MNWLIGVTLLADRDRRPGSPATRCPTTCCRAPGCASPTRSVLSIPLIGHVARLPVLRRRVPGRRAVPTPLRPARAVHPRADRGSAGGAPGPRVAPEAHAVPRAGDDRGERRRHAGVAQVRAEGDRPGVRDVRRADACWAAWCRSTRSGSTGRSSRTTAPVAGPARLVRRLAGGAAPPVAELGVPRVRPHDRRTVPAGGRGAGHHLHRARALAVPGGSRHATTPPCTTIAQRPREAPVRSAFGAGGIALLRPADARRLERRAGEVPPGRGGHAQHGAEGPACSSCPSSRASSRGGSAATSDRATNDRSRRRPG